MLVDCGQQPLTRKRGGHEQESDRRCQRHLHVCWSSPAQTQCPKAATFGCADDQEQPWGFGSGRTPGIAGARSGNRGACAQECQDTRWGERLEEGDRWHGNVGALCAPPSKSVPVIVASIATPLLTTAATSSIWIMSVLNLVVVLTCPRIGRLRAAPATWQSQTRCAALILFPAYRLGCSILEKMLGMSTSSGEATKRHCSARLPLAEPPY